MANELTDWMYLRVNCPTCGALIFVCWPPDDREQRLIKHKGCGSFVLTYRQAAESILERRLVLDQAKLLREIG